MGIGSGFDPFVLAYGHKNAGKNQIISPVISHHWPCLHCSCSPFYPFFAFLINLYRPIPSLPWMHCDKKTRRYNPMTKNPGSRIQSPESRLFKPLSKMSSAQYVHWGRGAWVKMPGWLPVNNVSFDCIWFGHDTYTPMKMNFKMRDCFRLRTTVQIATVHFQWGKHAETRMKGLCVMYMLCTFICTLHDANVMYMYIYLYTARWWMWWIRAEPYRTIHYGSFRTRSPTVYSESVNL
jgi:hypothetical protein